MEEKLAKSSSSSKSDSRLVEMICLWNFEVLILCKGTVVVILSERSFRKVHTRFTTVPWKPVEKNVVLSFNYDNFFNGSEARNVKAIFCRETHMTKNIF